MGEVLWSNFRCIDEVRAKAFLDKVFVNCVHTLFIHLYNTFSLLRGGYKKAANLMVDHFCSALKRS